MFNTEKIYFQAMNIIYFIDRFYRKALKTCEPIEWARHVFGFTTSVILLNSDTATDDTVY